ncbi:asparagine--tRNA ligase [bacterium DOLZORAL124_38_8]|nr:MAG: asparagine--tRNA ligase [bacterium DOLZORAL124_38_8]
MKKITIRNLVKNSAEFLNKTIELSGWVRTIRSSSEIGFISLHDGTFFQPIQVVFEKSVVSNFETIAKTSIGSALKITGTLVESQGKGQSIEIQATAIEVLAGSDADFPLQKKRHSFEFLRTIAHLRPRTNTYQAVFRLRSKLAFAIHKFFQDRNFVYTQTPIITGNDCEGAGEMFQVTTHDLLNVPKTEQGEVDFSNDFFADKTGLTVSGQLNAEAYALAFQNVYTFGPTFRAENSNTSRHASEFWMVEPEMAFANLEDDMDVAEEMIKYLMNFVMEELPEEMEFFNKFIDKGLLERLNHVRTSNFERLPYTKAIELLEKADKKFEFPVSWGLDLQSEHEQYLCETIGRPVIVTDYPKDIKAFYMHLNDDEKTVAAMDVLVPGIGEIIGGSQREVRLDVLDKRMAEIGVHPEGLEWYRDLRRFGGVDHAGFGLGFERMVMYVSGMENIRDVISFPRTPRNAKF